MADVSGALADLADYARDLRDRAASKAQDDTIANTPVSEAQPGSNRVPGTLRDNIILRDESDDGTRFSVSIVADTDYAGFVDDGTDPHPIVGNPNLTFWWPEGPRGVGFYTYRSVMHPGTQPRRFFTEPMPDRWENALNESL